MKRRMSSDADERGDQVTENQPDLMTPVTLDTQAPTVGDVLQDAVPVLAGHDLDRLPSVRADGGLLGPLWLSAASRAGRSHLAGSNGSGTSGQDAYCFGLSDDSAVAVIAVADGLGSHVHSHRGASAAVIAACQFLVSNAVRDLLDGPAGPFDLEDGAAESFDLIGAAVTQVANEIGDDARVATTLVAAVIDLRHADRRAVLFRVGDSNAFVLVEDRFVGKTVFPSKLDGPANQVSASFPSATALHGTEAFRMPRFPARSVLVLASDGVADDIAASPALRRWFESRWTQRLDATAMADTLAYRRRGSIDDRTALAVHLGNDATSADVPSALMTDEVTTPPDEVTPAAFAPPEELPADEVALVQFDPPDHGGPIVNV